MMRLLAILAPVFLLFEATPTPIQLEPPSQKASIEGTVVRIGTGEPVAARVSVTRVGAPTGQPPQGAPPVNPNPNAPPGAPAGAVVAPPKPIPSVTTDNKGSFLIKDL